MCRSWVRLGCTAAHPSLPDGEPKAPNRVGGWANIAPLSKPMFHLVWSLFSPWWNSPTITWHISLLFCAIAFRLDVILSARQNEQDFDFRTSASCHRRRCHRQRSDGAEPQTAGGLRPQADPRVRPPFPEAVLPRLEARARPGTNIIKLMLP